jgi:photosystem II PsbM protein
MQVNDLGFVASILFVLVPAVFLVILYIQTASREGKKRCLTHSGGGFADILYGLQISRVNPTLQGK